MLSRAPTESDGWSKCRLLQNLSVSGVNVLVCQRNSVCAARWTVTRFCCLAPSWRAACVERVAFARQIFNFGPFLSAPELVQLRLSFYMWDCLINHLAAATPLNGPPNGFRTTNQRKECVDNDPRAGLILPGRGEQAVGTAASLLR